MAITHEVEPSEQHETIRQTVQEVEERLAVMLGVPVPTKAVCTVYGHRHTREQICIHALTHIRTCASDCGETGKHAANELGKGSHRIFDD